MTFLGFFVAINYYIVMFFDVVTDGETEFCSHFRNSDNTNPESPFG